MCTIHKTWHQIRYNFAILFTDFEIHLHFYNFKFSSTTEQAADLIFFLQSSFQVQGVLEGGPVLPDELGHRAEVGNGRAGVNFMKPFRPKFTNKRVKIKIVFISFYGLKIK
jgi:hypothetical protein